MRQMAIERKGEPGLSYAIFKKRLDDEKFTGQQNTPLQLRLQLLESFMKKPSSKNDLTPKEQKEQDPHKDMWDFKPGSLTIVDLSCPFVDEADACVMFNICLALFIENRGGVGRIVALDEAHKVRYSPNYSVLILAVLTSPSSWDKPKELQSLPKVYCPSFVCKDIWLHE